MIVSWGLSSVTLRVKSYTVDYDSGIEWTNVGGVWHYLDRGSNTAKWSSDITVEGDDLSIYDARELIIQAALEGQSFKLSMEAHEKVFGPEFDYVAFYTCFLDASEEPYNTGNLNTSVPTEWTFTAKPLTDMTTRFIGVGRTVEDLEALHIQGVDRLHGVSHGLIEFESYRSAVGFHHLSKVVELPMIGTALQIAYAKCFLMQNRGVEFEFNTTGCFIFESGVLANNVYCLDVQDDGQEDKAGLHHRIIVTLAKA